MAASPDQASAARVGLLPLWFGLLGGHVAWTLHLVASYFVVPLVCATGLDVVLYGITLGALLLALAATFVAWRSWRRLRAVESPGVVALADRRAYFMAILGALLSGLFFMVILAQALPIVLHHPCDPLGGLGV